MAFTDVEALTAPVSPEEPCGPDLDLAGDLDYMNYMARAEGLLPASFFSGPDGRPFDRTSIDFEAEFAATRPFLEQTHDLRLLGLLAKLLILNRDLAGFETCIRAIATLLEQHWQDVHPRGEDGDYTFRMAAIETLDDMPHVIFPLQYTTLTTHRRFGPIAYRSYMIATGEAKPREGEEEIDVTTVEQALMEAELPELIENRRLFDVLNTSLNRLRDAWMENAGSGPAVKLEKLPALIGRIVTLLNDIVSKRDPSVAPVAVASADGAMPAPAAPAATGSDVVKSMSDVARALAAVSKYFSQNEPSNPALLLVRQAEQLMGKSFLEVMRVLVPTQVEQAAIHLGKDHNVLDLPLERLAEFAEIDRSDDSWGSEEDTASYSEDTSGSADESGDDLPEDIAEDSAPDEDGADGDSLSEPVDAEARQPAHARNGRGADGSPPAVRNRRDAIILLEHVGAYYRAAEPSSPIPILTDRARNMAERDFLTLLKDLLPAAAFKPPESE